MVSLYGKSRVSQAAMGQASWGDGQLTGRSAPGTQIRPPLATSKPADSSVSGLSWTDLWGRPVQDRVSSSAYADKASTCAQFSGGRCH